MRSEFDDKMKAVIQQEAARLDNSDEILDRIGDNLNSTDLFLQKENKYSLRSGLKKYILAVVCAIVFCGALALAFSGEARALASQAVSSIKNIFVMEVVDGKPQIVEKPEDQAFFNFGRSIGFNMGEKALAAKLSFPARFPGNLGDGYYLMGRSIGVTLKKELKIAEYEEIEDIVLQAAEDDIAFKQLAPYKPYRNAGGAYHKAGKYAFAICIYKTTDGISIEDCLEQLEGLKGIKIRKVSVGTLKGS